MVDFNVIPRPEPREVGPIEFAWTFSFYGPRSGHVSGKVVRLSYGEYVPILMTAWARINGVELDMLTLLKDFPEGRFELEKICAAILARYEAVEKEREREPMHDYDPPPGAA